MQFDNTATLDALAKLPPEAPKIAESKSSAWTAPLRAVPAAVAEAAAGVSEAAVNIFETGRRGGAVPMLMRGESLTSVTGETDVSRSLRNVAESYAPDPVTAGEAERLVFGLTRGIGKAVAYGLTTGPAAPFLFGADEGLTQMDQLQRQGVDTATAAKAGGVAAAVNTAGFLIPVAGKTIAGTIGLGALSGPASFVAQQASTREILRAADYGTIADQFDPLDPVGLSVSLLPFGFGAWAMRARAKGAARPAVEPAKPGAADQPVPPAADGPQPASAITPGGEPPLAVRPGDAAVDRVDGAAEAAAGAAEPARPAALPEHVDAAMVHNLTLLEDRIRTEIEAAGRPLDEATASAALVSRWYEVQAQRIGVSPQELADRYRLTVAADGPVTDGALNQSSDDPVGFKAFSAEMLGKYGAPWMPKATDGEKAEYERLRVANNAATTGATATKKPAATGVQRLYHKSPRQEKFSISAGEGQFGGVFASVTKSAQGLSAGEQFLHHADVPEADIAGSSDLWKRATGRKLTAINKLVRGLIYGSPSAAEVAAIRDGAMDDVDFSNGLNGVGDGRALELLGEDDVGLGAWRMQYIRGQIASALGFKAVKMSDEFGTSYLVLPGVELTPGKGDVSQSATSTLKQDGGATARGAFTPATNTITLFKSADASTFVHESGHFFLESQLDMARTMPDAGPLAADAQTLLDWFGVKSLDEWAGMTIDQKRPHHEQFAQAFERYLAEGKAPAPGLQGLFDQFASWLKSVYSDLRELGGDISPAVRGVMDRMLATGQEIAAKEPPANVPTPEKLGAQARKTSSPPDAPETPAAATIEPGSGPDAALIESVRRRGEQVVAEAPDLVVGMTEDGQPITARQELERIRREAAEGTADELGADDAPLLDVAVQCALSVGE